MKKTTVYKGKPVSIDVYNLTIEGRKVRREIIQHPGASAILAFDEKGKILLVSQHRFPHGYVLEIPAGTLEKGDIIIGSVVVVLKDNVLKLTSFIVIGVSL